MEHERTFTQDTNLIFFGDANHDAVDSIQKLIEFLKTSGIKDTHNTLFLEFLYEEAFDHSTLSIEKQFMQASGSREHMCKPYTDMAREAKKLGFNIIGLTLPDYSTNIFFKNSFRAAMFRNYGSFDRLVAEIIKQKAAPERSIVFLGKGHVHMLRNHFNDMVAMNVDEEVEKKELLEHKEELVAKQMFTNELEITLRTILSSLLMPLVERSISYREGKFFIRYHGKEEEFAEEAVNNDELLKDLWRVKFGEVPTPARIKLVREACKKNKV